MPSFVNILSNHRTEKRRAIRQTLDRCRDRLQVIEFEIAECFLPDGGITRRGLQLELSRLDEKRRRETNPVDTNEQSLIQGQQNEVEKLMALRQTLEQEARVIQSTIAEAETELKKLTARMGGKNNA